MGRRKGSKNGSAKKGPYFDMEVEECINKYNISEDKLEREELYKKIHPAFVKLIEFLIWKYKFLYFDTNIVDLIHETEIHLIEKLDRFKGEKGKAFSYFHIVARNRLIVTNTDNYKKIVADTKLTEAIEDSILDEEYLDPDLFLSQFIIYLDKNIKHIFNKKEEIEIADCILTLVKRRHNIDNLNKKAIFLYLREMLQENNSIKIAKVMKVLRLVYKEIYFYYIENEYVDYKFIPWSVLTNVSLMNTNFIEYE